MTGLGPEHSIDLGAGVYMRWLAFAPDRVDSDGNPMNESYADLPDNPRTGIIVGHVHADGEICEGAVLFDNPENHRSDEWRMAHGMEARPLWQVESLEPLTISPSILMSPDKGGCGLHGFIRNDLWVTA